MPVLPKQFFSLVTLVLAMSFSSNSSANELDKAIVSLRDTGKAFASIAAKTSPSVVYLQVEQKVDDRRSPFSMSPFGADPNDDFFEFFFGSPRSGPREKQTVVGQGSGFFYDNSGHIITNYHVVGKASKITVRLTDGRKLAARLVGHDQRTDIAIIKVDNKESLPKPLTLGDSETLEVGEWVVAIGNPFGLSNSITAGIVSAKGRSSVGIAYFEDFIQTDAAINPGNSGGPLVDLFGRVIGVNSAIYSRSGGYMGIGFAIPANVVARVAKQIIDEGSVTWGYLGVRIQELTAELANSFGIQGKKGILVADLELGTPAEKAGLRQGDVIIGLDGKEVKDVGLFRKKIALYKPNSKHKLEIIRNGKKKMLTFTVGELPKQMDEINNSDAISLDDMGIEVQDLTPDILRQLNLKKDMKGVVVSKVIRGSIAERASIQVGSVITEVNRKPVKDSKEFKEVLKKTAADKSGQLLLLIQDSRGTRFIVLSF